MDRGTRELLQRAEGRVTRSNGVDSDDDVFQFGQNAITEDTLRDMRRKNEANMARAIAVLRGDTGASQVLPAVYGAGRGAAQALQRPPRRKQRLSRPQTPSEIRDAAEKEASQRERFLAQRQPQHRPPQQQGPPQRKLKRAQRSTVVDSGTGEHSDDDQAPMSNESQVLFGLLDWQTECRLRGVDSAEILKLNPRGMYNKEIKGAEAALRRHNRILGTYLAAGQAAPNKEEGTDGVAHPVAEGPGHSHAADDSGSVAASYEHSVSSMMGGVESETRLRRERRLEVLLAEAREMRGKALSLVHQGGVDVVTELTPLHDLAPAGRNMLQVLHNLLETGLANEVGLLEERREAAAVGGRGVERGMALRQLMIDMEAHKMAAKKLQVGKKRAYDDPRLLPSQTRLKRQRDWLTQVKVYASWEDDVSSEEPATKKKDAMYQKTMMLLRVSDRWVVSGDEAGDYVDLEGKLSEIQRRNKRNARMAVRTQEKGPPRFVLYDSDESEEDLYEARRAPGKMLRKKRKIGQPYRRSLQALSPARRRGGYAPDGEVEEEEEEEEEEAGMSGVGVFGLPEDRRRLREIAKMRKARLRGEKVKAPASDLGWMSDVLPQPSEEEDEGDGAVDSEFMRGPLARQMGVPMSQLKGEAMEKQKNLSSMEQKLLAMRADASLAMMGGATIGQTQEKIYREVHKIRKLISGEVRGIFADIALAREKLQEARDSADAERRDLLTQEAQRLLIEAETRANALRERYRKNPDMNLDFMPEYLRNFLTAGVSAQTMFDRGRLEAVQARAEQVRFEEERREVRAARRRKQMGLAAEESLSDGEVSDSGLPILTVEEKLLLKEMLADAKQLNVMLLRVEEKAAAAHESDGVSAMDAADNATEATALLESAMQMHRALKRKLKGIKARKLRPTLPFHLRNIMTLSMPLQQMWREGLIEPAICEAIEGLNQINLKIGQAKAVFIKYEEGEELAQEEEDEARQLLEAAIVESVAVRERARASMLDVSIGGAGLSIKRFPKHVINLLVSDESVIVLWEKGLIDKSICLWLDEMVEINQLMDKAQKQMVKASSLGETPQGLEALAHVDTLSHEADVKLQLLRREVDLALLRGLSRRRLPPHLLNILNDRRSAAVLYRLGKLDPLMSLFEQHAARILKSRRDSRDMEARAQRLMDSENRKAELEAAGLKGEKALEEMLQLRAKVLVGGILPSEAPPGSALAKAIAELEDEMEEGLVEDSFMHRVLEQLGLSEELISRLKKVTRERKQVVLNFAEIEWETLIGRPAAYLPQPEVRPTEMAGVDASPVQAQDVDLMQFPDGFMSSSGVGKEGFDRPIDIEWIETELEKPTDETLSNLPVLDDLHPRLSGVQAAPLPPDADGDDGPTDAGMTQTDVYIEQKERKQQKKYDSDDDDEPDRQGKKKKMKNVARGRLEGKQRSGIPVDVRRKITELILEAKKTLKIDISELELPYIPKQVLDCVFIESLIADRNLLDEVDPQVGRMGNLSVLSLSWNRIESPLPISLWELNCLRTLNLDHNQIDEIPGDIEKLSSLTKLRLDANNIEVIPPNMGERTNLKYLALDRNNLVDLPPNMKKMLILSTLTLSRNAFTFVPKCIFSMKKLKVLHVHHNEIPVFPTDLDKLKNLTDLNFGANLLTSLPDMISRLVTLKKLDVSKNEIQTIGPEIEKLTNLEFLALSYNLFKALPEQLSACIKLQRLNVNANKLSYLPQNITRLAKLEVLDLRNNAFIAITPQIGRMSTITSLRVEGNDIRTPPPYVCDLETQAMLRFLDRVDQSYFTGVMDYTDLTVPQNRKLVQKGYTQGRRVYKDKFKTIPAVPVFLQHCGYQFPHGMWTGMGGLKRANITDLNLAGNGLRSLTGVELNGHRDSCLVPHMMAKCKTPKDAWEIDPLSNLQKLQLQGNRLEELPTEVEFLTALTFVDLTSNSLERLSGPHIATLTNLRTLNLHNNPKLRRLPNEMGLYDLLTWLDVTQCMLVSPPPVIVQRGCRPIINYLRKLYDARFSYSLNLDGENLLHLPIDVAEHTFLTSLSLRDNAIAVLPPSVGDIVGLYSLRLDSNYLARLPTELGALTGLTELGLSRNMMQHINPDTLLEFQNLRVLDLAFNQLRALPSTIAELSRLTDLDASNNALPTLPFEMHRLTNLTRLRLHRNVLRLPLKDLADDEDIGVLLEFLRTCANAQGDKHKHYKITPTRHLDLSRRPYKVLPPEVLRITALETLKLSHYGMEYMAEGIGDLVSLTHLELHDNRLHGLPDKMHQLTNLRRLSLSRNWLCRLPYCLSSLVLLQDLQVDENQLSVIFADIAQLTALTEINARGNCLRQITPALVHLTGLVTLDLSYNQLSFVPAELGVMTHLFRLSLRNNYISELPTEWHLLAQGDILSFDVQDNGLKSPPPEILARGSELIFEYLRRFHLARESGVLDLSDMGLSYMPADVMRFYQNVGVHSKGLKRLILDGNRMSWLPNYLRTMTTLTHVSLRNCVFTRLPYFLGDLRELTRLDLQGNDIQSPPDEIIRRGVHAMVRYMRAIDGAWWTKELDISGQRFENVPIEICDVDSLTSLRMHSQYFSDVPTEIGRLSALTLLDLQHCQIVEMPGSIGDCYNLRELVLNNNKLITVPASIGGCTGLTDLRLHENMLEELPPTIGNCTLMQDLRLFNNNLLDIPVEIGNMRYLPALRVSSNQLAELTIGIGGLQVCSDFLAADNYLETLPPQIGLLTSLTRLRLANNRLTSLPDELGNLYNLTELGLSDNKLRELPPIGHLTALRSLLVANNPLTLPPDRILRKGTFAVINYLRVLYEARGAPPEVVERGQLTVEAFHEAMEEGRKSNVLSLRARLLEAVPKLVHEMVAVTELNLECNLIEDLHEARLGDLAKLRVLKVSYNQILAFPPDLRALSCLTELEAQYNFLSEIPLCICRLPLQRLVLDSNEIKEVPEAAAQLTGLTSLSLTNNAIRKIAESVPTHLTRLETLFLQRNELMTLPTSLKALQRMHTLDVSFNQLFELPHGFASMTTLRALRLSYNELELASLTLDGLKDLEELRLTCNRLSGIPHTFAALKKLTIFQMGGNMFFVEPQHQFLKTWEATQKYLRLNLESYQHAQMEQTLTAPLRRGKAK